MVYLSIYQFINLCIYLAILIPPPLLGLGHGRTSRRAPHAYLSIYLCICLSIMIPPPLLCSDPSFTVTKLNG